MIHLRTIAPSHRCDHIVELLKATPSVTNLVFLERAAQKPEGDVILCDVAREDAGLPLGHSRHEEWPADRPRSNPHA